MTVSHDTAAQNAATVRAMHEAFNAHDFGAAARLIAPDATNHGIPVGPQGYLAVWHDIHAAFPDIRLDIVNLVAEGEWVSARCTFSGTHLGVQRLPYVHAGFLFGHEPTGKPFSVQHIHLYRLQNGLIAEHYANRDDVDMLAQLGLPLQIAPGSD